VHFDVHGHKIPGLLDLLHLDASVDLSAMPLDAAVEDVHRRVTVLSDAGQDLDGRLAKIKSKTVAWLASQATDRASEPDVLRAMEAWAPLASTMIVDGYSAAIAKLEAANERLRADLRARSDELAKLRAEVLEVAAADARDLAQLRDEQSRTKFVLAELQKQVADFQARTLHAEEAEREARRLEPAPFPPAGGLRPDARRARPPSECP
jgi:chromosome segregation ATPase